MYTTKTFIEKAKQVHGNKYDYSKVDYINSLTKVCIICPEHGEFWQTPNGHLRGDGCLRCREEKLSQKYRLKLSEIIKRFTEVHGNKYNYSRVEYKNIHTKVCIICPIHGEFWQTPHNHLKGNICPECYIEAKRGNSGYQDTFITKAREIHGNKYDYSKVHYINKKTPVTIICPIHGEFEQTPDNHLSGCGCKKCGILSRTAKQTLTTDTFIKKGNEIHNHRYSYDKVIYVDNLTPVCIICPEHGEFWQTPHEHLAGCGCSKCTSQISKPECEISEILKEYVEIENNVRNIIPPKEIDIYIPSKKIGIEYNGLLWHSEEYGKDKYYHLSKLEVCKKHNIKLVQIFEDEYVQHKDIVLQKLKHLSGISNILDRIPGRKTTIIEIDNTTAQEFLTKYHLQGYTRSTVYLGAFYNNSLIAVMTFKRETKSTNKWELTRFASNYNYICQGVGGKLFNYFVRKYQPEEVKSFADRRWTVNETDNIYTKLGFEFDSYTPPDYKYIHKNGGQNRIHKFNCRKQILYKKYGLPLSMTETEMVNKLGYSKIWDCGLIKYVWYKTKKE